MVPRPTVRSVRRRELAIEPYVPFRGKATENDQFLNVPRTFFFSPQNTEIFPTMSRRGWTHSGETGCLTQVSSEQGWTVVTWRVGVVAEIQWLVASHGSNSGSWPADRAIAPPIPLRGSPMEPSFLPAPCRLFVNFCLKKAGAQPSYSGTASGKVVWEATQSAAGRFPLGIHPQTAGAPQDTPATTETPGRGLVAGGVRAGVSSNSSTSTSMTSIGGGASWGSEQSHHPLAPNRYF